MDHTAGAVGLEDGHQYPTVLLQVTEGIVFVQLLHLQETGGLGTIRDNGVQTLNGLLGMRPDIALNGSPRKPLDSLPAHVSSPGFRRCSDDTQSHESLDDRVAVRELGLVTSLEARIRESQGETVKDSSVALQPGLQLRSNGGELGNPLVSESNATLDSHVVGNAKPGQQVRVNETSAIASPEVAFLDDQDGHVYDLRPVVALGDQQAAVGHRLLGRVPITLS